MKADLYTNAYIINYPEGDKSLQRRRIIHKQDIEDKSHIIKDGDTLSSLAYRYYRDPLKWFLIADINNLDNPFLLEVGISIIIPNLNKYDL